MQRGGSRYQVPTARLLMPLLHMPAGGWVSGGDTKTVLIYANMMKNGDIVGWAVSEAGVTPPVQTAAPWSRCRLLAPLNPLGRLCFAPSVMHKQSNWQYRMHSVWLDPSLG